MCNKGIEMNRIGEISLRLYELLDLVSEEVLVFVGQTLAFDSTELDRCLSVYREVRGLVPFFDDEGVKIKLEVDFEIYDLMVVGETNFEDCVDLAFNNWENWLGFSVEGDTLMMWGSEIVLLYVLREMSLWGSSHVDVLTNIGHEMLMYT